MRIFDQGADERSARPKSARIDPEPQPHAYRAAATGRPEVLDADAIAGLQRSVGNAGVTEMLDTDQSPVHGVVSSGGGAPLAPDVRDDMEGRLGHDFSDVRVHTDAAAQESARAVNANAYTVGTHVVFQRDRYDPGSSEGKTMLAHELTHVVQQRSGPVDGTAAPGGIRVSDPSDRFEREAVATAASAMASPARAATADGLTAAGSASVQRDEEQPEDETAQTFVQRAEVPDEEEQQET